MNTSKLIHVFCFFVVMTLVTLPNNNLVAKCGDGSCKGKETPESCPADCSDGGGGGGDGGGKLGPAIPLDCLIKADWGDKTGYTIMNDKLLEYQDAVDKVTCEIGGPSVPWPIRLVVGGGNGPSANVRQVDMVLGEFNMGTLPLFLGGPDLVLPNVFWGLGAGDGSELLDLHPSIFYPADPDGKTGYPDMDDMDTLRLGVRPYRLTQTTESIHLLPADKVYEMGMNFTTLGTGIDRFTVSIASKWYEGNENFTGISCETGYEQAILDNSPAGAMEDVSVYLWPDDDADGLPDAYTVTTGSFVKQDGSVVFESGEPKVNAGPRYAAVCSAVGPKVCGNPNAPSNCNFLGYVGVQFTLTAKMKSDGS